MPSIVKQSPKPKCIACGGTGKNSKGGPCVPCQTNKAVPMILTIGQCSKASDATMFTTH